MRTTLKNILQNAGFEVVGEAGDGEEAVELYKQLKPDVVTMDITMPKVDGIQAIKLIKSDDPDAKIVVCSAMGQKPLVVEAIKSGARDFVVKPFQPQRVVDAVTTAVT
jgi:two-component system chemotaxis response regulator CheY